MSAATWIGALSAIGTFIEMRLSRFARVVAILGRGFLTRLGLQAALLVERFARALFRLLHGYISLAAKRISREKTPNAGEGFRRRFVEMEFRYCVK